MKNDNLFKSILVLSSLFIFMGRGVASETTNVEEEQNTLKEAIRERYGFENINGLKLGGGLHLLSTTPSTLEDYKKDFGDSQGFFIFMEKGFALHEYFHLGLGLEGSRISVKDKDSKLNEEMITTMAEVVTRFYLFPIRDRAGLVRPFIGGKFGRSWVRVRDFKTENNLGKKEEWATTVMTGVDFTNTKSRISFHVDLFGRKAESNDTFDEKGLQLGLGYLF